MAAALDSDAFAAGEKANEFSGSCAVAPDSEETSGATDVLMGKDSL